MWPRPRGDLFLYRPIRRSCVSRQGSRGCILFSLDFETKEREGLVAGSNRKCVGIRDFTRTDSRRSTELNRDRTKRLVFEPIVPERASERPCGTLNGNGYAGRDFVCAKSSAKSSFTSPRISLFRTRMGHPMYQVKGKIFSLHHTLVLMDLAGNELATVNSRSSQ